MKITDFPHLILKCPWVEAVTQTDWFILRIDNNFYFSFVEDWDEAMLERAKQISSSLRSFTDNMKNWEVTNPLIREYIFNWAKNINNPLLEELVSDYVVSRRD